MKLKNWIIGIACLAIGFSSATIIRNQAIKKEAVSIPYRETENHQSVTRWMIVYLESHINSSNRKNRIQDYQIRSIEHVPSIHSENGTVTYRVQFDVYAEKNPSTLFSTEASTIVTDPQIPYFNYDIVIEFDLDNGNLKYYKDEPSSQYFKTMHDNYKVPEDVDTLSEVYRVDETYLKVKVKDAWIKTPVLSESLKRLHQNWYVNDQKLWLQEDRIGILYNEDSNTYYIQSLDLGLTWEEPVLMDEGEIGSTSFGSIQFEKEHGYIVLLNYVAINAEVMTIFETKDNGVTWQRGETKNQNVKIQSISMIDDALYIAKKNDDALYRYHGLQADGEKIEIPEAELQNTNQYTESLGWRDIYDQAEAPSMQDGVMTMLLTQGEDGDHDRNSQAVYISNDKGSTWQFDRFIYPEIKKPTKN